MTKHEQATGKSENNVPKEPAHDPAATPTTGTASETLARNASGRSEPAGGVSPTSARLDPQLDGAGTGISRCESAEAASGSTRPLDSTRELNTAAGVLTYSALAERLAVNIAHCLEWLFDGNPADLDITGDWIRDIHRQLAGELFPDWAGRYRTTEVQVGTHLPPAPHTVAVHVESYCRDLAERLNHVDDAESVAALLAWADWRFQWIHPFKDFNGRVGRILLVALCFKLNLPPANPAADDASRTKYFDALRQADRGDFASLNEVWMERLGA